MNCYDNLMVKIKTRVHIKFQINILGRHYQ
jgi:hypothetical protein